MCLPLHGFAMQWGALLAGGDTSIAHEIEHDEHVQHHHEDDGSIHYDDSDESAQHLLDHPASPQPAHMVLPVLPGAPPQLVSTVATEEASYIPDPLLDCPHRPPASTLG
jgi:hypothetical protein